MASDRSGFAARYRSSRQRLQFQRHMFNHMTKPCPLLHTPQEASRLGIAAAVPGKAGKELHQRSGESIKPTCRPILPLSENVLDAHHRPGAVSVGLLVVAVLNIRQGADLVS